MNNRKLIEYTRISDYNINMIRRDEYLKRLIDSLSVRKIKIITGIRRSGKSYLLFTIFKNYLLDSGIAEDQIIGIEFDKKEFADLKDPDRLVSYIDSKLNAQKKMFLFLDEVQLINGVNREPGTLYSILRNYSDIDNLNVFVTGSNSKFLSKDIETEFRGRGHIIKVHPLSFREYYDYLPESQKNNALRNYAIYGGMPGIFDYEDEKDRIKELNYYFNNVYINDIVERYHIENPHYLDLIITELSSAIGSLASPSSIYRALMSNGYKNISLDTVANYFIYLEESFMFSKCMQFNIKGKEYFKTKYKFYIEDIGLRNAKLGFRQLEPTHIYENLVYLELVRRGYSIDIGVVPKYEKNIENKTVLKEYEVDFVIQNEPEKKYIQYAYHIDDKEKYIQETKSFRNINDGFKKIIITNDEVLSEYTQDGYTMINIKDFLLNQSSLD